MDSTVWTVFHACEAKFNAEVQVSNVKGSTLFAFVNKRDKDRMRYYQTNNFYFILSANQWVFINSDANSYVLFACI